MATKLRAFTYKWQEYCCERFRIGLVAQPDRRKDPAGASRHRRVPVRDEKAAD
jgi:hypothetical protein